jgi:hypothetical protein
MRQPQFIDSGRTAGRQVSYSARRALCLALLLALPGGAQNGSLPSPAALSQSQTRRAASPFPETEEVDPVDDERRLRALNAERQKSLVSDTNKLLKLASELNEEVSSTNPDSLTLDQLHKLAEIEKLAHSVKDKMSTSVRGTPVYQPPFPPHF